MSLSNLTPKQLRKAANILEKIEELQSQLNDMHGNSSSGDASEAAPSGKTRRKRRKISAAGIARIRAAQKLRWAKVRASRGK